MEDVAWPFSAGRASIQPTFAETHESHIPDLTRFLQVMSLSGQNQFLNSQRRPQRAASWASSSRALSHRPCFPASETRDISSLACGDATSAGLRRKTVDSKEQTTMNAGQSPGSGKAPRTPRSEGRLKSVHRCVQTWGVNYLFSIEA